MNLLNINQQSTKSGDSWDKTGMGISPDPFGEVRLKPGERGWGRDYK